MAKCEQILEAHYGENFPKEAKEGLYTTKCYEQAVWRWF